jgi:hypothetical protein
MLRKAVDNQNPFHKYRMRFYEIISEDSLPVDGGAVIDLRLPTKPKGYDGKVRRTHVCFLKGGRAALYYYADGNRMDWRELMDFLAKNKDSTIQQDVLGIVKHGTGWLIGRDRSDDKSWSGDRNRYSGDNAVIAKALLDSGLATERTPIWLGNWAANEGEHIGTVGKIVAGAAPTRLTLYHGTSSIRLGIILKEGLKPLSLENRVWNKGGLEKERPAHRDDCVYLTASKPQAEYYANQAVKIDRKRLGPDAQYKARNATLDAKRQIQSLQGQIESYANMTDSALRWHMERERSHRQDPEAYRAAAIDFAKKRISELEAVISKNAYAASIDHEGKVEPVVLQVTLGTKDIAKLMADDDYLRQHPEAKPEDGLQSLSYFGQVAYRGVIPPNRIRVVARGDDATRRSR